jgi:hypothetical protein
LATYAIFEINTSSLEVYHLIDFSYQRLEPNDLGHYPIPPLGVELGVWQGRFLNNPEQHWLRWWDRQGNLLSTGQELAEQERQKRQRLTEKLRSLNPDQLNALGIEPEDLT